MKLTLENFANIENAKINLNGLTVLTGKTNTGKEYITKALFGIIHGLYGIDDLQTQLNDSLRKYGIGVERVALKNILEDSVLVFCVDKSSNETHKCTSEEVGDIPSYVDDHVRTDYISVFQYNDQIIKSINKDIYDQVEVGEKYNARIKILVHNDQTKNYDVAEIISKVK